MAGLWQDPFRTIELAHRVSAAAGLVGKEGYAVTVDGAAAYALAAAGGANFRGVCTSGGIAATDKCGAAVGYCPAVIAGAVVAEGAALTTDASGRFITATSATSVVGVALEAAGAANEFFRAYVFPAGGADVGAFGTFGTLTLTAAAEVANVIAVTVASGRASAEYVIEAYEATMIEAAAAAVTMAETGTGAEVSTTAQARLVFTVSAAGAAVISVTDVPGASGKTFQLLCYPTDGVGRSARLAITFD